MTRTALKRNGLAEFRMRSTRQGAKALSKQRSKTELLIYQLKFQKKLDFFSKKWYNIITERKKGRNKP